MSKQKRAALKAAFPHTLPVMSGFLLLGFAYGVLMNTKGYGPLWSTLMSAIAYCGSMQYVAVTLLTTAFDPLQALLLSFMVNARHLFYGLSLLKKYQGMGWVKPLLVLTVTDESFSLAHAVDPPPDLAPRDFYLAMSLLCYSYWVLATLSGGLLGTLVSFNTEGLDFVLTALFIVLFLNQLTTRAARISGGIGVLASLAALAVFGPDSMVIPAMVLILALLLPLYNRLSLPPSAMAEAAPAAADNDDNDDEGRAERCS